MRSHVFSLCPDSHFALEQFRNCTAQSKNSYFARQSENSHFAQDNSGIVPILTLRRTYTLVPGAWPVIFNLQHIPVVECLLYCTLHNIGFLEMTVLFN